MAAVTGFLTATDFAAMYERASKCDDDIRRRRGLPPRPTRCRSCVTILSLLAHIELAGMKQLAVTRTDNG